MRIIYADVIFAENFASDWLVLYFCKRLLDVGVKNSKLVFCACLGSLYAVAHAYFSLKGIVSVACTVAISALLCAVCFGVSPYKKYVKSVALFYTVSFLLCGAVSTVKSLLVELSAKTGIFSEGLPMWVFFAACSAAALLFSFLSRIFHPTVKACKVKLEIQSLGKKHSLCVLCDTGNLLRDPYSNLPVIILKGEKCKEIAGTKDVMSLSQRENLRLHLRYVPVKTASHSTVMPAIKPERILYVTNKKSVELCAVVAFDTYSDNTYDDTSGIMPYCLIQNIE